MCYPVLEHVTVRLYSCVKRVFLSAGLKACLKAYIIMIELEGGKNVLTVFVAEDNYTFGKSVCEKIKDEGSILLGWARDGHTALADILEFQPDLVLVDIKMPLLDGLSVIEQAREQGCTSRFVIISGYDEFSFAQKAIQLGVAEYLLKPFTHRQLAELLQRAEQQVYSKRRRDERSEFQCLLNNQESVPLPYGSYCVCLVNVGPYAYENVLADNPFFHAINLVEVESSIREKLPETYVCYLLRGLAENEICVVFAALATQPFTVSPQKVRGYFPETVPVHVCSGGWFGDQRRLFSEVARQRQQLRRQMYYEKDTLLNLSVNQQQNAEAYPMENWERLLEQRQWKAVSRSIRAQVAAWEICHPTQYWLERQVYAIAQSMQVYIPFADQSVFLQNTLQALCTHIRYAQFGESLLQGLQELFQQSLEGYSAAPDVTAREIQKYLETHFTEKTTMEDLSQIFCFSNDYISKLFKQYYGETPMQYLLGLRIRHAESLLLKNPDLNLRQVSEQSGFFDKFHFSKTFKKVKGCSPQEYRSIYAKNA